MPVSWKGTLVQYVGRLHRLHPGTIEVRIYDYVDRQVPLFQRMFEKQLRGYRAIGHARDDGLLILPPEALEQVASVIRAKRWGGNGRGRPRNLLVAPGQTGTSAA